MKPDVVLVTFQNENDEIEVKSIAFTPEVLSEVKIKVKEQFEKLKKLVPVDFSGSYKADEDEILCIEEYKDTDKSVEKVISAIEGEDVEKIHSAVELKDGLGLFFHFSDLEPKFVFQRITSRLVLDKKLFYRKVDKDTFGLVPEEMFTIGSSLQGYFKQPSELYFCSTLQTRSIFPTFSSDYVPGATKADIEDLLSQPEFEEQFIGPVIKSDSQTIARLVWLIRNDKQLVLKDRIAAVREFSNALHLDCITKDGKIRLFKEVNKTKLVLQMILGDVFRRGDQIFVTNSKRALKPFDN